MGRVYLAVQPAIGSRVAVKILSDQCARNPELLERFFAEARAVNLIRHERIVSVIDLAQLPDGRPFIIMEYVEGQTLAGIAAAGPVPLGGLIQVMTEVLSALAAAHAIGIVHRDLKPDNVLVTAEGHAKVLDFGIAKLAPELRQQLSPRTGTGALLGTPQYMAPEQISGSGGVEPRTDVYAAGVVLYELATGRQPFVGETLFDLMRAHLEQPPRPPRQLRADLPAALEQVILTALAKQPEARFASATVMAQALHQAGATLPPEQWRSLSARALAGGVLGPATGTQSYRRTHAAAAAPTIDGKGRIGLIVGAVVIAAIAVAITLFAVTHGRTSESPGEPRGSGAGSVVAVNGVGAGTEAPVGSTQAPVGSVQGPVGSTQPPVGSAQGPGGSAQPPVGSAQGPVGSTQPAVGSAQGTIGSAQGSIGSAQGPGGSAQKASGSAEEPSGSAEEPSGSARAPGTVPVTTTRSRAPHPLGVDAGVRAEAGAAPDGGVRFDASGAMIVGGGSAADHGVIIGPNVIIGSNPPRAAPEPARDSVTRPADYDAKRFDPVAYVPRALKLARELLPDAQLTSFEFDPVFPDGHVDLTMEGRDRTYEFRSPAASAFPAGRPRNLPFDRKCRVSVELGVRTITANIRISDSCDARLVRAPRCSFASVWKQALAKGIPSDLVARIGWLFDETWFFDIDFAGKGGGVSSFADRCP